MGIIVLKAMHKEKAGIEAVLNPATVETGGKLDQCIMVPFPFLISTVQLLYTGSSVFSIPKIDYHLNRNPIASGLQFTVY